MNKYYGKRKKTNFIIAILALFIIGMAIGYALFSSQLQITGTVTGSGHFKVYFIEAWVTDPSKGTASINTTEGSDRVTYNVTLNYPGDKCLVGTKIKNESSFRVKLNDFAVTAINSTPDIIFDYIPLDTTNEKLDVNGICDYRFTIEWDANSTNPNPGPVTFEIGLEYEQDPEDPLPDPSPSHNHGEGELYNAHFNPNGGTVSKESMQITDGKKYGDMPVPERQEYTFLGWYTKLENGTLVTKDSIVHTDKDIILYAMWNWDGHNYNIEEIITEPTCTENGEKRITCSTCGDAKTEVIQALGHNMNYTERVEPTCTEAGNVAYYRCLRCNKTFSDEQGNNEISNIVIPATGHDWDSGNITVNPTCTETGTKLYTCLNDSSHTKTETVPATGHNITSVAKVDATCTTAGNIAYYKCTKCNKKFSDSAGTNEITNVTIAALGHSLTTVAKVDATCTASGNNAYYKCTRCNKLFKDASATVETTAAAETIAALGHSFGTSYVQENSSYHAHQCSRCGAFDTATHQSHTWSGLKTYSETSLRYDYHYQDCTVSTCNARKRTEHNNDKGYTYTNQGDKHLETKNCSCGVSYDSEVKSHTYNKNVSTNSYLKTKGTCTTKAVYYKSCVCGQSSNSSSYTFQGSTDPNNHNYVSGKCKAHANGGSAQVCSRCGRCQVCGSYNTTH